MTTVSLQRPPRESFAFIERVVRRYVRFGTLSQYEIALLRSLASWRESHQAGTELCNDMRPSAPRFIVDGWAGRTRILPDGRRQILAFLLPSDGIGICTRPNPQARSATIALTPLQTVNATALHDALLRRDPSCAGIHEAFAIIGGLGEVMLLDHIVRLGRQTAYERTAHLFLELRERLAVVGMVEGDKFVLPLTQDQMAEALGLSVVHMNRTLQQMRRDGLIETKQGHLKLLDLQSLMVIADFRQREPSASTLPQSLLANSKTR
jgi:CRP-like cAMP-binding protein